MEAGRVEARKGKVERVVMVRVEEGRVKQPLASTGGQSRPTPTRVSCAAPLLTCGAGRLAIASCSR